MRGGSEIPPTHSRIGAVLQPNRQYAVISAQCHGQKGSDLQSGSVNKANMLRLYNFSNSNGSDQTELVHVYNPLNG